MKSSFSQLINEQGSVMIIALLMLSLLTIIGISAAKTSGIEIQIAANEKFHKIAFYNADSGIYVTPKLISLCVDSGEIQQSLSNITYLDSSGEPDPTDSTLDDIFYYEIMGYEETLERTAHDSANDMRFALGSHDVDVDIERTGQESIAGGGVEFSSGAEGVGTGSTGGVALLFTMDSFGNGPGSSQTNVEADYRKVLGIAGGL